ncbi:hypothetical protein FQZ97_827070 [compost metagenome]
MQDLVDQREGRGEGGGHGREGGLAAGQRFCVAHKGKALVDRVAQHVGQVVEVERGDVARLVLHAQSAERPGQRVAAFFAQRRVHVHLQRGEARAFGQQLARGDAVRQRRVPALQEGDHQADGGAVARELVEEGVHAGRALRFGLRQRVTAHGFEPGRRKQLEHQCQRQVGLHRIDPARAQEAGDVRGGGVGRVDLRHRWDEAQHTQGGGGHGRCGEGGG